MDQLVKLATPGGLLEFKAPSAPDYELKTVLKAVFLDFDFSAVSHPALEDHQEIRAERDRKQDAGRSGHAQTPLNLEIRL